MTPRPAGPGRARRLGVRARLLGLALIPSLGLAGIAGADVAEHRRLAEDADELVAAVDGAAEALRVFLDVTHEYRVVEIVENTTAFGLTVEQGGELLEMDLVAELADVRDRIDANPAAVALVDGAVGVDRLTEARANIDAGEVETPLFADLVGAAEDLWLDRLAAFRARDAGVALRDDLRRALHAFQTSSELFELANDELLLVSELAVPGSADRLVADRDLDRVTARYEAALDRLVEEAGGPVGERAASIIADRAFYDAVERLDIEAEPVLDVAALGALFRTGLARFMVLQTLTEEAAAEARALAVDVGREAEDEFRDTLVLGLGIVAATLVLALVASRSIAGPLTRLARRAAEVSDGELDGPPLPRTGPREVAVLAGTINDAVENLRVVEDQIVALAVGDVAAASAASAPGKLGALVGRSVDSLARSIAERDQLQRRLAHDAAHDALTGLPNRRTAMAVIQDRIDAGEPVALLFLDLDGFKLVNDEQGHAVGDTLLTVVSERLRRAAPVDDLVARLGGDEFVVATSAAGAVAALALADRLVGVLDEPVSIDGLPHRLTASVGLAMVRPGDDADRLLRSADAALYEAKRAGRGRVVALDDALRDDLETQHQLEADLRAAIVGDDLELHYQPVFETATGALHGVEALVRWRKEDGTLVPPDRFIPAAERSGLIVELDRWVLSRALHQVSQWRSGRFPHLQLSVNVSASTLLSSRLVHDVQAALRRAGVTGEALVVEVTETALLHDLDTAADRIDRLHALGVRTSVDDFGTGYTSVSHLRRLPVAEIKIDRSFVQAMGSDERDRVLVDLVVRIGTVLDLDVVAEGVETDAQLDTLRRLGCRYAQGYLLGRPAPAADFEAAHAAASASA